MEGRIVIIDGNSLINRAYYAMQRPMITKEGLYTHGVYGFINMLTKIQKDYAPAYMGVTFDKKAPTFRHKEYDGYKANRKKMPPELAMQLPFLKEVLGAMNIKTIELEGYEGDDLIGTLARRGEEAGLEPLIITGDKDALQLCTDKTRVLITRKGISQFDLYDREEMINTYGFTPQQFIDYKGLMGDSSDNIPGLPGVGEKTAQKLILEYGSVENLIENADKISAAKLREKVQENAQLAVMSKRLATIITNVPIDIDFDEYKMAEPDRDKLIDVYSKLEFNSFLKRMQGGAASKGGAPEQEANRDEKLNAPDRTKVKYEKHQREHRVVEDVSQLREFFSGLQTGEAAFLKILSDGNHRDVPEIFGIGLMGEKQGAYVKADSREVLSKFLRLLVNKRLKLWGHYLIEDYYLILTCIKAWNLEEELKVDMSKGYLFDTAFDTAIAQYVLEPTKSKYDLKILALEMLHREFKSPEEFIGDKGQMSLLEDSSNDYLEYLMDMGYLVEEIMENQKQDLRHEELEEVYNRAELPLIEPMAAMEAEGFSVDLSELKAQGEGLAAEIEKLTEKIYSLAGEEFNINSPAQLGVILFEKLGLPAGKKTKKGYSTSAEVLDKLMDKHEIVPEILNYRTLSKLKSTYIDGIAPLVGRDGKVHAKFQQTVTATGRISCIEPNLQNIPVKQEEGRKIRRAYVPDEGYCLVGADYSQIELRVLAHLSGEEHLIDAFKSGEDIHRLTASRVFGVPLADVSPIQRRAAKAVNFGVIYGMSAFGLSGELNITRKEAEGYIKEYFLTNTRVKSYMDGQIEFCREHGFVKTILGRKRHIHEIKASNFMVRQLGERLAMNTPIQGSAADIIKLAMVKVYRRLKETGLPAGLILQVHDELILMCQKGFEEKVEELLKSSMEEAMNLSVQLSVEMNRGNNWYELK